MRGEVPRFQSTGQHLADLLDDGHVHPLGTGKVENGSDRGEAFGGLLHLLDDVRDAVTLAE